MEMGIFTNLTNQQLGKHGYSTIKDMGFQCDL